MAIFLTGRPVTLSIIGIGAILFGGLTIVEGGQALFNSAEAATKAAAVPFVLWFNFAAGFAYIVAGFGLLWRQTWAVRLSIAIAAATLLVFAAFCVHVLHGGQYLARTPIALTLRSAVWVVIAIIGWRTIRTWEAVRMISQCHQPF